MKLKLIISLAFFSALTCAVHAQSAREPRINTLEIKESEAKPVAPIGRQLRLFEIKHRDPAAIANAVKGLASSGASVQFNEKLRTLTVNDFAENVAAIEAALKRLDAPESAPASFDIQLHVLAATDAEERGDFPSDLEAVVAQLRKTLKYRRYAYITTFTGRVQNGGAFAGSGVAPSIAKISPRSAGKSPATSQAQVPEDDRYRYNLGKIRLATDSEGKETLEISQFTINVFTASKEDIGIQTSINLREGENVVVGTTSVGENALIVVVSAKKLN
jgi:type II secretory pathway component GspD/PulD (secretin)